MTIAMTVPQRENAALIEYLHWAERQRTAARDDMAPRDYIEMLAELYDLDVNRLSLLAADSLAERGEGPPAWPWIAR